MGGAAPAPRGPRRSASVCSWRSSSGGCPVSGVPFSLASAATAVAALSYLGHADDRRFGPGRPPGTGHRVSVVEVEKERSRWFSQTGSWLVSTARSHHGRRCGGRYARCGISAPVRPAARRPVYLTGGRGAYREHCGADVGDDRVDLVDVSGQCRVHGGVGDAWQNRLYGQAGGEQARDDLFT
jgi:hypothetical protein